MKNRKPDFIIGGAPKSGTSSLYFWLDAHPECCGSRVKETFFWGDKVNRFNEGANHIEHGKDAYGKFFSHCPENTKPFEATAHYLYYQTPINEFSAWENPPKMIFLLREPSAQIYSHYRMERFRTKRYDGSFKDYLDLPKVRPYAEYAQALQPWFENYPNDKIGIWTFEELMSNKVETMKAISEFLEIDGSFYTNFDFEHRNETVAIKSGWLHQLGLKLQPLIPNSVQKALLPIYLKMNSGGVPEKSEDELQIKAELKKSYRQANEALHKLVPSLNITDWK